MYTPKSMIRLFRHSALGKMGDVAGSRGIHRFEVPRPEVMIANNSGLFFALEGIRQDGLQKHPRFTLIVPDFWIDKIHSDYDALDWGQSLLGFPAFVRNLFLEIYPRHRLEDYVRWGQYRELRLYVLSQLKSLGLGIYKGMPGVISRHADGSFQIPLAGEVITTPDDTFFYNLARVPNRFVEIEPEYGEILSHTSLYTLPKIEVPERIILLGAGRSAIWAARHFSNTSFLCIGDKPYIPYLSDELQPPNIRFIFDESQIETLTVDTRYEEKGRYRLTRVSGMPEAAIQESGTGCELDFRGLPFAATGLSLQSHITASIPSEQLQLHPCASSDYERWYAPQELPQGSLMAVAKAWALITSRFEWTGQTFCFHAPSFEYMFTKVMQSCSIALPAGFYENLYDAILREARPLSAQSTVSLFTRCFIESHHDKITANKTAPVFASMVAKIDKQGLFPDESMPAGASPSTSWTP